MKSPTPRRTVALSAEMKKETRMIRVTRLFLGLGLATIVLLGSSSIAHAQYQAPPPGYQPPPPPPGYYPPPPGYGGYPPPPPRYRRYGMYREGLIIGGAIGFGGNNASDCGDECGSAFAFELHIGGMITPQVALVGDFWFNDHPIPNSDASMLHSIYTFAIQYWPMDKLWLKGGIGGGNVDITSDSAGDLGSENGLALMGAGGVEVLQAGNFALDLQLRVGHGFYSQGGDVTSWALMIGTNWY
jgi:hypothetical protein